jgi:hypothetical protein
MTALVGMIFALLFYFLVSGAVDSMWMSDIEKERESQRGRKFVW